MALFSTSLVAKMFAEFGGQGHIKSFYPGVRWPKSESDKVKLKEDTKNVDVAKRNYARASKKRKNENGAH